MDETYNKITNRDEDDEGKWIQIRQINNDPLPPLRRDHKQPRSSILLCNQRGNITLEQPSPQPHRHERNHKHDKRGISILDHSRYSRHNEHSMPQQRDYHGDTDRVESPKVGVRDVRPEQRRDVAPAQSLSSNSRSDKSGAPELVKRREARGRALAFAQRAGLPVCEPRAGV
ncbi:hypothetical protein C0992_000899 [Termitomyces sp. T32_za158]|nr:hypothetical protein C0992_000899 [Termitomyces sp. T32_za158]